MRYERVQFSTSICAAAAFVLASMAWGGPQPLGPAPTRPPSQAAMVGYKVNTFSTTAFTDKTVDVTEKGSTFTPGYQWYPGKFYYNSATNAASIILKGDGTIELSSDDASTGNCNSQISSFAADPSKLPGFTGISFGGGGYFEATFKFDPTDVFSSQAANPAPAFAGWPSWWGMATEHLSSGTNPGSFWYYSDPTYTDHNYAHFIETDFFEYLFGTPSNPNIYAGSLIDWYGDWGPFQSVQNDYGNKRRVVPRDTDFTQYHKYGFLWVPATSAAKGYDAYYFDGKQVGPAETWTQYQGQGPKPDGQPWCFGVQDQQHIGLIIGSGIHQPMTIQSVNVWQSSPNWNINTGTLYDTLYDFSLCDSHSANMITDNASPASFNGDACRVARRDTSPGAIVYRLVNLSSFTARYFLRDKRLNAVSFAVSKDKVKWTPIDVYYPRTVTTTAGWAYRDLNNRGRIPIGMEYLKITLSGKARSAKDQEIGQVSITAGDKP